MQKQAKTRYMTNNVFFSANICNIISLRKKANLCAVWIEGVTDQPTNQPTNTASYIDVLLHTLTDTTC